ncbi:unnamed protein product [Orchesella dallaii]|uniref:Uncharacterized protein n=1 Tax=Orchesella dallaii TaxID=48710 RepID=A0ABP1RZA0_9HEXA
MGDRQDGGNGGCFNCILNSIRNFLGCFAKLFGTTIACAFIIIVAIILVVLLLIGGIVFALYYFNIIHFEGGKPGLNPGGIGDLIGKPGGPGGYVNFTTPNPIGNGTTTGR